MSNADVVSQAIARGALLDRITPLTSFAEPHRFELDGDLKSMLLEAQVQGASDIFIQPDMPVVCMIEGHLKALTKRVVDDGEVVTLLRWLANDRDTASTDILAGHPVNGRYELFDPKKKDARGAKIRYPMRVNATPIQFHGSTSCQIVTRMIPQDPPTPDQVGIIPELLQLMTPRDGIVYIVGVTGSGKTTSLASVIRYALENDTAIKGNFITGEEPIEFDFSNIQSGHSIITQSQIGVHFDNFADFIREAMRKKPALILVGELRDRDSITAAIEASNTGHPVFGTAHATNVALTARRLISRFPSEERETAIYDIIESTRVIVAQRLVPGVDGRRVAAREYLAFTDDVKERLVELTTMGLVSHELRQLTQSHGHSFAKEAERLLDEGKITSTVARELAAA
jgi:defect in organelle trafficking protein DotB